MTRSVPPAIKNQIVFLGHYGNFLALWSTFDVMVEIVAMKELRITPDEASIICGGLGFGGKLNMITSLLKLVPGNEEKIAALHAVNNAGQRNSFAHGFFRIDRETGNFSLMRREIKDEYIAKKRQHTYVTIEEHLQTFTELVEKFQTALSITDLDVDCYTAAIEARASALESRAKAQTVCRSNFKTAKRRQRGDRP